MRKIILNLAVTLDGFIEGPNGETDWCRRELHSDIGSDAKSHFDRFLESIDTIFYGRVSYDKWGEHHPLNDASPFEKNLWEGVHSKKKYVFTRKPKSSDKASFITTDIPEKILEIKNQPGKNIWLYGGAGLITSLMNLGLVDNFLLAVYPVILGSGKPLFSDIKNRVGLRLNGVTTSESGIILLNYDAIS